MLTVFLSIVCLGVFMLPGIQHVDQIQGIQDIQIYRDIAGRMHAAMNGSSEAIRSEYPPLAAMLFFAASLGNWSSFAVGWITLIGVTIVFSWFFILRYARSHALLYALTLPIASLILGMDIIFARYDFFVGNLVLLSIIFYRSRHIALTACFLALAASIKVVPIIGLPLLWICAQKEQRRDVLVGSITGLLLGAMIPISFLGFGRVEEIIGYVHSYHAHREIQVETMWSGVSFVVYHFLGMKAPTGFGHMTVIYTGVGSSIAQWLSPLSAMIGILSMYILSYHSKKRPFDIYLLSTLLIALFFAPVLSPQYIVWCVPSLIYRSLNKFCTHDERIDGAVLGFLTIVLSLSTMWIFPLHYGEFLGGQTTKAIFILNIRNLILLVLPFLALRSIDALQTENCWNVCKNLRMFFYTRFVPKYSDSTIILYGKKQIFTLGMEKPWVPQLQVVLGAFLISLLQSALVLAFAHGDTLTLKIHSLLQWDTEWFSVVVDKGYWRADSPGSTVPFLPAYPFLARLIKFIFHLTTTQALLLTSQISLMLFWGYIILIFKYWKVERHLALLIIMAILVFPTSFFMTIGYSEAIFVTALIGTIYWSTMRTEQYALPLAMMHGLVLSLSRFIGVVFVVFLLAHSFFQDRSIMKRYALICVPILGGILSYFTFLWSRFGNFFFYFKAQHDGWGVTPDYIGALTPRYLLFPHQVLPYTGNADALSHLLLFLVLYLLIGGCIYQGIQLWMLKKDQSVVGSPYLILAALLIYVPLAAMHTHSLYSISRYMLPPFIVMMLFAAKMTTQSSIGQRYLVSFLEVSLCAFMILFTIAQSIAIHVFSSGGWVA